MIRLLGYAATLSICCFATGAQGDAWLAGGMHETAFELVVHQEDVQPCTHLSLRTLGTFKGLVHSSRIYVEKESQPQRTRRISSALDMLWAAATSSCGEENTWTFPTLIQHDLSRTRSSISNAEVQSVLATQNANEPLPPVLDIQPLSRSGPSNNRVDFTFFADGYTESEKQKFFDDAARLAAEISGNQTFNAVKPLINFWAAFTASKESGIGADGQPKDTPFGLYRPGTELRGVYYSKPEVARAACFSMGTRCDQGIIVGNDPLYGGIGGEFTVITPSLANGALVLRHELGHSVIPVGEEYDGGYAYFGVNAHHDADKPVSWAHWLSDNSTTTPRVERSVMPLQDYAWTMLNNSSPWSTTFNSSGTYARHLVRFSLSNIPDAEDLVVTLDGEDLGWTPRPGIGEDRWHYDIHRNMSLAEGEHVVSFDLKSKERSDAGNAQLCSVEILEFGDEEEFEAGPGYYGLFPTFSEKNETSYRPTNEDCLMRVVTTPNFCDVCTEGLWLSLARRVNFIDRITSQCLPDVTQKHGGTSTVRQIDLHLVPLAQFRDHGDDAKARESYTVKWMKGDLVLEDYTNWTSIYIRDEVASGTYRVEVTFTTDEVRVDKEGYLTSTADFVIAGSCED